MERAGGRRQEVKGIRWKVEGNVLKIMKFIKLFC